MKCDNCGRECATHKHWVSETEEGEHRLTCSKRCQQVFGETHGGIVDEWRYEIKPVVVAEVPR